MIRHLKAVDDLFFNPKARLDREDLIACEHYFKDALREFLPFKSYSLHFPDRPPADLVAAGPNRVKAVYLREERKVLVPLVLRGAFLGVFTARGVRLKAPATMGNHLPRIATLCLEKLLLYKMGLTDPSTGLMTHNRFLFRLERELELLSGGMGPEQGGDEDLPAMGRRASLGVVRLRLDGLEDARRRYGIDFVAQAVERLAETFAVACPEQGLSARLDDESLAMLLPEASPNACRQAAKAAVQALSGLEFFHEITETEVRFKLAAGTAHYPRDVDGRVFEQPVRERADHLLGRASMAAAAAMEQGTMNTFTFGEIVSRGGKVVKPPRDNRLEVSLGRRHGASEGMRFLVFPDSEDQEVPTGEVVLVEVRDNSSLAEIMTLTDAAHSMEAGDCLRYLPGESAMDTPSDIFGKENGTGLYSYRDFLALWEGVREEHGRFALTLVRLAPRTGKDPGRNAERFHAGLEKHMARAADLVRKGLGAEAVGGRWSLNSLIWFHPDAEPEQMLETYNKVQADIRRKLKVEAAVGIACHPCLHFAKADALDNCRKALEYALLLPEPRVGLLDSLALNISADKQFSLGDLHGAMEEYKLALLLDEHNTLAGNSLGVCLARLGKLPQAKRRFEEIIAAHPEDAIALYNLGNVCGKLGETRQAQRSYARCLQLEPDHLYCLVRLGRLAEGQGKLTAAKRYYERAAVLEGGRGLTRHYLAALSLKRGEVEQAREFLQQALIHDPRDARSMYLLAKLYLDAGESLEIAEVLARQSVALRPGGKIFWRELARAFEVQGKETEARDALARAEGL
jgi:tetratricopeptide (TPR) repeat protein/GGDEF domain-containing protein